MNLKKYAKHAIFIASLLSMAALFSRCSSGSSGGTAAAAGVTISGAVASVAASAMSNVGIMAIPPIDLEVYGLALSDPPEVKKVNLGADGSFTLSFSSAAVGAEISLIFRYKVGTTNAGKQIGLVKFVDNTKKNIDGTDSSSSSMKLAPKILVCDDDELLMELLQFRLEAKGFEVLVARDGREALQLIQTDVPDAVVLDGMMPGIDGFEVLRRLRENAVTKGIPVIMLTARKGERDIVEALQLGASDYLSKPFIPDELTARLMRLLSITGV